MDNYNQTESYKTISETGFNAVAYRFYVALLIMFNNQIKVTFF